MLVCPPPLVLLRVGNSPALFVTSFVCLSYPYFLRVGIIPLSFASAAKRFCSPTFARFLLVAKAAEAKSGAVHVLSISLFVVLRYKWIALFIMHLHRYFEVLLHLGTGCLWCNDVPMRWRICRNSILRDFATRPFRSVFFRCDDEKYVFRFIMPAVWCAASF